MDSDPFLRVSRLSRRRVLLAALGGLPLLLPGCASDSLDPPEPTVRTPGAFVAYDEGLGALSLLRVLDVWYVDVGTILFATFYDVAPQTWEEAAELSKRRDLPMRAPFDFYPEDGLLGLPHRVVWFRTLSAEEAERIP